MRCSLRTPVSRSTITTNAIRPIRASAIPYEQWSWRSTWDPAVEPGGIVNSRLRLIEHVRTRYRPDDLGVAAGTPIALLALGAAEQLGLPGETYKLAFTPALLTTNYGN